MQNAKLGLNAECKIMFLNKSQHVYNIIPLIVYKMVFSIWISFHFIQRILYNPMVEKYIWQNVLFIFKFIFTSLVSPPLLQTNIFYSVSDKAVIQCLQKCRPYLVHLNLRQCYTIHWPSFKAIAECANLQDLNLSECKSVNVSR